MIHLLKYLGFIASAMISFQLYTTNCNTIIDYVIASMTTIVLQSAGFIFYVVAKKEVDIAESRKKLRFAYFLLGLSIIGTVAFQCALMNQNINEAHTESESYVEAKKNKELNTNLLEAKEKEIEAFETSHKNKIQTINNSIAEYKKLEKAQKNLYTDRINEQNKNKNNEETSYQQELTKKNKELAELTKTATSPLSSSNVSVEINYEKGYLPLAQYINQLTSVNIIVISLIFQTIFGVALEITAIKLYSLSLDPNYKSNFSPDPTKKQLPKEPTKPTTKPRIQLDNSEPLVSCKNPPEPLRLKDFRDKSTRNSAKDSAKKFRNKEISDYLDAMYESAKLINNDLVPDGYIKLSKKIKNMTPNKAYKIKSYLEELDIIKTVGAKTIILKNREEVAI